MQGHAGALNHLTLTNMQITVRTTVNAPLEKVWTAWTEPEHITKWCFASDDWEAPTATNDLRTGGSFTTRMQAKDGSFGFDMGGTYDEVRLRELIAYTMGDGRKVRVEFAEAEGGVEVRETFDMEHENSEEKQRDGWQAILENFKKHAEAS